MKALSSTVLLRIIQLTGFFVVVWGSDVQLATAQGIQAFVGTIPPVASSLGTVSVNQNERTFFWTSSDSVLGDLETGGFVSASTWNFLPGTPARLVFTGSVGGASIRGDVIFEPYNRAVVDLVLGIRRVRYVLFVSACAVCPGSGCPAPVEFGPANGITARFLDGENTAIRDALMVSNFLTTAHLDTTAATRFDDLSLFDVDNFRLEIEDPGTAGPSVKALLSVVDPSVPAPSAPRASVIYTLDKKMGAKFRGPFLRLVSDTVDDVASGHGAAMDPDKQTILVTPRVDLVLQYARQNLGPTCNTLPVCRPANETGPKAIRRVNLDIRIAFIDANQSGTREAGEEVITPAGVQAQIDGANERWAQACIRVSAPAQADFKFFRLPADSLDGAGSFKIDDPNNEHFGLGSGAVAVPGASVPAGGQNVTVYFVPTLDLGFSQAYPPVRLKIAHDIETVRGRAPGAGQNQANANTVFIPPEPPFNVLAHELGHILVNTNDSDQPRGVLFPFTTGDNRNTVNAGKRLVVGPVLGSNPAHNDHIHAIGWVGPPPGEQATITIRGADFDVPAFARITRDAADLTGFGNRLLQP